MQNHMLFAARFEEIAGIIIFVVVGLIRFLYGFMKKPDVPAGGPQQPAAPNTPEALQQEIEKFIRQAQGREPKPAPLEKQIVIEQRPPEPVPLRQRLPAARPCRRRHRRRPVDEPAAVPHRGRSRRPHHAGAGGPAARPWLFRFSELPASGRQRGRSRPCRRMAAATRC